MYEINEERGMVELYAEREDEQIGLDGERTTNTRQVKIAEIPDDADTAKDVLGALHEYLADQSSSGPPGQKPMHQQYAEVEPSR